MKHCTTCKLDYAAETIRFCRFDGTMLAPTKRSMATTVPLDLDPTPQNPEGQGTFDEMQSIAVLPFVNMSVEPDNDVFCDGLSEEITHALASSDQFQVAARTSSFVFKNRDQNVCDIGRALKVTTILEGSVRRTGRRLRVSAQLIDANSGYHIWSKRYDREMKDAFDLQHQISIAIVGAITSQQE